MFVVTSIYDAHEVCRIDLSGSGYAASRNINYLLNKSRFLKISGEFFTQEPKGKTEDLE